MQCPICEGKKAGNTIDMYGDAYCSFCDGREELDWIEYIFGVKRRNFYKFKVSDQSTFANEYMNDFVEEVAKKIAEDIEKTIVESLIKETCKDTKEMVGI